MDSLNLHYDVPGDDFTRAGAASGDVKRTLKQLGVSPAVIRNVAVAMYEGEINMVIHAGGGEIDVEVNEKEISMTLSDPGPGIEIDELAMKEGYSTAPDNIRCLGFGAGMGLPNIKKYTDEFKLETEVGVGTTLCLKVYIQ